MKGFVIATGCFIAGVSLVVAVAFFPLALLIVASALNAQSMPLTIGYLVVLAILLLASLAAALGARWGGWSMAAAGVVSLPVAAQFSIFGFAASFILVIGGCLAAERDQSKPSTPAPTRQDGA